MPVRAANGELRPWIKPSGVMLGLLLLAVVWRASVPNVQNTGTHAIVPIQAGLSFNPTPPPTTPPPPPPPPFAGVSFAIGGGGAPTFTTFRPLVDLCARPLIEVFGLSPGVVSLGGCGWAAGWLLSAWLSSDPIPLGTIETDRWGEFEVDIELPNDVPYGEHTINVAGPDAYGDVNTVSAPVGAIGTPASTSATDADANQGADPDFEADSDLDPWEDE